MDREPPTPPADAQMMFKRRARRFVGAMRRQIDIHQRALLRSAAAIGLVMTGGLAAVLAFVALATPNRPNTFDNPPDTQASASNFTPPSLDAIPAGAAGDSIRKGKAIFDNPSLEASAFVGNGLACKNCHLDSGRRANSSPMWAAWVAYPQYRAKNHSMNTMEDRILGCFRYSMNAPNSPSGGPPPPGSDVYRNLEAYMHWLASGAPTGKKMAGAGFPVPALSSAGFDPQRGSTVYQQKCSGCHGSDGQGAQQPDGTVIYPPLWGGKSYNWGAGMARVDLAAGFIKGNMPFDQPGTLSDQEAWDVAAFVDSHERPRDPRQTGTVAANAAANFKGPPTYYGKVVNGTLLGTGVPGVRR